MTPNNSPSVAACQTIPLVGTPPHQTMPGQQPSQSIAFPMPPTVRLRSQDGWRLPRVLRRQMEAVFGTSFADVRIHVGPEAASLGLEAFALGCDIFFAPGRFDPATPQGRFLLGHELTHVLQQKCGRVRNPFGSGVAVVQDPALEAAADEMGLWAAAATRQGRLSVAGPHVVTVDPVGVGDADAAQAIQYTVTMRSQWGPGRGIFVDLNCGWYCLEAAVKWWANSLGHRLPDDLRTPLPYSKLDYGYDPAKDQHGKKYIEELNKPANLQDWENLLTNRGPIIVSGALGAADWGPLGGVGHFILITGAETNTNRLYYKDPLQGNTPKYDAYANMDNRMDDTVYAIQTDQIVKLSFPQ